MISKEELIKRINGGEALKLDDFASLTPDEKASLDKMINEAIIRGDKRYYKYIPFLGNFDATNLLAQKHKEKLSDDNWYELVTEIYLRKPSPALLESIAYNARTNKFALEALKRISLARPDIVELPNLITYIETHSTQEVSFQDFQSKGNKNQKRIIYFKLTSGLTIKIDSEKMTAYRLNEETKQWQEDSFLFTEYEYGNLVGQEFEMNENYPYGERYRHGRHL